MADPVTMAVIAGGAGVAKGVGGFKAGQASSQASCSNGARCWTYRENYRRT